MLPRTLLAPPHQNSDNPCFSHPPKLWKMPELSQFLVSLFCQFATCVNMSVSPVLWGPAHPTQEWHFVAQKWEQVWGLVSLTKPYLALHVSLSTSLLHLSALSSKIPIVATSGNLPSSNYTELLHNADLKPIILGHYAHMHTVTCILYVILSYSTMWCNAENRVSQHFPQPPMLPDTRYILVLLYLLYLYDTCILLGYTW